MANECIINLGLKTFSYKLLVLKGSVEDSPHLSYSFDGPIEHPSENNTYPHRSIIFKCLNS